LKRRLGGGKMKKKLTMAEVNKFFEEKGITVTVHKSDFRDDFFFIVRGYAKRENKRGEIRVIAKVTALSRLSTQDMESGNTKNRKTALGAANSRAKKGLYKILNGRPLHLPLYQGCRTRESVHQTEKQPEEVQAFA
jgi:hypothetical protein